MKFTLKLLLILSLLLAGIYAATPLWLPYIVSKKLPPAWQLEKLESGYPGLSGINISLLRVGGELGTAKMVLTAADTRLNYRGLKTDVDSLSLDVYMQETEDWSVAAITPDDLSLPVISFNGELPQLAIRQMRATLHQDTDVETGKPGATGPLVLVFEAIKLALRPDGSFHAASHVSFEEFPRVSGRVEVDVSANLLKTDIRFPAAMDSPAWLAVQMQQERQADNTATRIQAVFDTLPTHRDWLDPILLRGTGGGLGHMDGKLEMQATFTGQDLQYIESVSLASEKLQLLTSSGTLDISAELLASRNDGKVIVKLPTAAKIQYQDHAGRIDDLLTSAVPGFQHTPWQNVKTLSELAPDSHFVVQAGLHPAATFNGAINFSLSSSAESLSIQVTDLQIEVEDFSRPESTTTTGLIKFDFKEDNPFAYLSDELNLKADKLSISGTGNLRSNDQTIDFEQTGEFEARFENLQATLLAGQNFKSDRFVMQGQLDFDLPRTTPDNPVNFHFNGPVSAFNPVINLPADEQSPPLAAAADDISMTAELISANGKLISTGNGILNHGRIPALATSAVRTEVTWQALDLLKLSGKLSTKTLGFSSEMDGQTWTGFDFDGSFVLPGNADINGSGVLKFENGLLLPIEFDGNTHTSQWEVTLPDSTIKLNQLGSLLSVAHFELPASIQLRKGFIDLRGKVLVGEDISATMTVNGFDMEASMLESSVRKASFTFNTAYEQTLSARGSLAIESVGLAGGIDVANLRADLDLENTETFALQDLYAEVFDGQLKLGKLRLSNHRIEDTTVELSHINLGRLLAFADVEGLQGTGSLEILLPVGSDETGIYIKNGTFISNGPGHLAYTKEGVAGSNIGLQALENFQYQVLSGTIDYQSNGTYQMAFHLEGKNPDLYGGHPIVFNLTINGLLPELFEAMFITGNFEESVLNQIRTH